MAWQSMTHGAPKGLYSNGTGHDLGPLAKLLEDGYGTSNVVKQQQTPDRQAASGKTVVSGFLPDLFVKAKPNIRMQQKRGSSLSHGKPFASFEQLAAASAPKRLAQSVSPARRPTIRPEHEETPVKEETLGEKSRRLSMSLNRRDGHTARGISGAKVLVASQAISESYKTENRPLPTLSAVTAIRTTAEGLGVNSPTGRNSPSVRKGQHAESSELPSHEHENASVAQSSPVASPKGAFSLPAPDSPGPKDSDASKYRVGSPGARLKAIPRSPNPRGAHLEDSSDEEDEDEEEDISEDSEELTDREDETSLLQEDKVTIGKHTNHDVVASSVALSRLPSYQCFAKAPEQRTAHDVERMKGILECCEPIEGLDPDLLTRLCRLVELCTFEHKAVIVKEGDTADWYYILLSGHVHVLTEGGHVGSVTIRNMGPGHGFGELAILNKTQRTAIVKVENQTGAVCARLRASMYNEVLRLHHLKDNRYHDVYCF